MKFIHRKQVPALAVFAITIAACSGGNGSPPSPPPGDVTLDRTTAPAASMIKVDGLELDACPLRTSEIRVGGRTAPTVLNDRYEALMRLPLFYDEGAQWAAPPAEPQDVEIFCNGNLWHTLPAAITITELPPAPGTTATLLANYQQIIADYKALTEAFAPVPGIQQQVFVSLFAGLEGVVAGDGPNHLPTILAELEQSEPQTLALLDAVLAVGDADETVAEQRERMEELLAHAPVFEGPLPMPATTPPSETGLNTPAPKVSLFQYDEIIRLTDTELADALSLYDGLKSFSDDFIGQTAGQFSTAMGIFTIVIKSRLATVLSTTLTLVDYILNKIVVSAFPAKLDKIQLSIEDTLLDNSESTLSEVWLHASNIPAQMSITDLGSIINTGLGIGAAAGPAGARGPVSWINAWDDIVPSFLQVYYDLLDKVFKEYAQRIEGFDYDTELFSIIPELKFQALGQNRELYLLWPEDTNVVQALPDQLNWRASVDYWGSAHVSITPTAQSFGAHGNVRSDEILLLVGDLSLVLDRSRLYIPEGDSGTFRVKLSNPPDEEVSVTMQVSSGDPDISVVVLELPIFFDSSNWDEYQPLTLLAEEDDDQDDGEAHIVVLASVDPTGQQLMTVEADLTAIEADNDRTIFVLDPSSVDIPEDESVEVKVKLNQEPDSRVTAIAKYASGDVDIEKVSPVLMRFDKDNWDVDQTVTLYARPDEDTEEGRTQFRVSANPPAEVDDAYITATEDEEDEDEGNLTIHYQEWNDRQTLTLEGTIQVELDPENFSLPLRTTSALTADFTSDYTPDFTGVGWATVFNHPMERACRCGLQDCQEYYERGDPEDTILAIEGRITWDCEPGLGCADSSFYMTLPFLSGTTFETICGADDYYVSYSAELRP